MTEDSSPFPASALDANKQGRLIDAQRQLLRTASRGVRKNELTIAALAVAFGIVVLVAGRPSWSGLVRIGVPLACVAVAAFLVVRAVSGDDRLTRDLRDPHVESLEGPIGKHTHSTEAHSAATSTIHYLDVAGQRFQVGKHAYDAAPEAGIVRIYYLSISRHMVNLEQLPDRTLPEGTTTQTLANEVWHDLRSHDRAKIDEVRAEAAGTERAMMAGVSHDATPPPAESRDERPLAEAIQGTWREGPMTAVFRDDGSFSVTILGMTERTGHWSVDGAGKLVTDFAGHAQPTDAWIVGDQLTVSLGGDAFTLKRASG